MSFPFSEYTQIDVGSGVTGDLTGEFTPGFEGIKVGKTIGEGQFCGCKICLYTSVTMTT